MEPVLLYDGVCNLCSASVQFILGRERDGRLRFASQQSEAGRALLARHHLPLTPRAVVLIEDGRAYAGSDAALRVARYLKSPWRLLWALRVVPRPLREAVYALVARSRYRLFGKREACWLPRPEWRARFLDA
ncbi:thiol-disulfide oxidoreductase DCC family protein [Deinococcus pimensis]|uniref:thiol-disulfide oxidoreductase DCC family protein n=1 Tax=Deinococcus pimensis TaxID=309888 RepID=UPI000483732B|nr:thiol-disulfide oxidoreductase DCC family protein [Deinococcus pimensis]